MNDRFLFRAAKPRFGLRRLAAAFESGSKLPQSKASLPRR